MFRTKITYCLFLCGSIFGPQAFAMEYFETLNKILSFDYLGLIDPGQPSQKNQDKQQNLVEDKKPQVENGETQPNLASIKLSQSMITTLGSGIDGIYGNAIAMVSKDPSLTLIAYIVKNNDQSLWESLIHYGFKKNKFSENDVWWVIKEYSAPYHLSSEHAQKLFDIVITNAKEKEGKDLLLTRITIHQKGWTADETQKSWGARSHSELHNILLETIERGYLVAFEKILQAFPRFVDGLSINSCTREEWEQSVPEGWFRKSHKYIPMTYSLINWLTRSESGVKNYYLDRKNRVNQNYIEAAKIMVDKILAVQNRTIDNELYEMICLLCKQDDLTNEKLGIAATMLK